MAHSFLLKDNSQTDNFLEEARKDPVTGEDFKVGDEVIFCAECKSAFLKDSWEYMSGEHCGQRATLKNFPKFEVAEIKLRIRKTFGKRLRVWELPGKSWIGSGFAASFLFLILTEALASGSFSAFQGVLSVSFLSAVIAQLVRYFSQKSYLAVFERGVALRPKEKISYQDIRRIEVSAPYVGPRRSKYTIKIRAQLQNRSFRETQVTHKVSDGFKKTLKAMLYFSRKTSLVFDENTIDYGSLCYLERFCEIQAFDFPFRSEEITG